jgi:hypothetical protein
MKSSAATQLCDECDLTLESCEDGLDFLAYVIREDLAEGRTSSGVDLQEARGIATELLAHAAKELAPVWGSSSTTGVEALFEPRWVRLIRAMRDALHPSTSRKELAEALQSAADLIRSTRQLDGVAAQDPLN